MCVYNHCEEGKAPNASSDGKGRVCVRVHVFVGTSIFFIIVSGHVDQSDGESKSDNWTIENLRKKLHRSITRFGLDVVPPFKGGSLNVSVVAICTL